MKIKKPSDYGLTVVILRKLLYFHGQKKLGTVEHFKVVRNELASMVFRDLNTKTTFRCTPPTVLTPRKNKFRRAFVLDTEKYVGELYEWRARGLYEIY